jgi:SsrA-binding protein
MHIAPYKDASYNNHEPLRSRKLLLNRREIAEIKRGLTRQGLTLIPTRLYFKEGWAKLTVALARGKKLHDKRQAVAKKEAQREMERVCR